MANEKYVLSIAILDFLMEKYNKRVHVCFSERVFKFLLVGDSGVGKSSLLTRFTVSVFAIFFVKLSLISSRMTLSTRISFLLLVLIL